MLELTFTRTPGGPTWVYAHGLRVGVVHDCTNQRARLRPAVITPAGDAHSLHQVDTLAEALTEIQIAVRQYMYLPHPIRVIAAEDPWTDQVDYRLACPTCHQCGVPTGPNYASAVDAARQAETDHHRLTGQYGVLVEHPRALPRPGPPTNSPYFR